MKDATRGTILTPELLEANGWVWEYPADHCNYKWYICKSVDFYIKYYSYTKTFYYQREVATVGELKDIAKVVFGLKLSFKIK